MRLVGGRRSLHYKSLIFGKCSIRGTKGVYKLLNGLSKLVTSGLRHDSLLRS